jgi:phage terminase large subunit-like protein
VAQPTPEDLKLSPEVYDYLLSRKIKFPTCVPLIKTPEPRDVDGAAFDGDRVDKVLAAFGLLRHTQGQWAGRTLTPDPWQVAYVLAPIFGWVRWDDEVELYVRIINEAWIELPRKNGKSTLSGGIGIYLTCADGEQGAQVVAAATSEKQAGYVFSPLRTLAIKSPALRPYVKPLAKRILHTASNSYIEVVASVAEALHGGNVHGAVIDEVHLHKTPDLIEAIETGTGARTQPLIVMITTADDGRQDTVYAVKRHYVEQLARDIFVNPSWYGVVFAAEVGDDPFAEATQRKANPGFGISPSKRALRNAALQAQQSPTELANYMRLHLGIRTKQATRYIDLAVWDQNAGVVSELDLAGHACFGGLDLASTSDLCALCWTFPSPDGSVDVIWRHWIPQRAFAKLEDRTAGMARVWADDGDLTITPGDVADYDWIKEQIAKDRQTFKVQSIAYDRWNASQLVTDLLKENAPMVQLGQGFASMSSPLKQINHMLLDGIARGPQYRHGGIGIMRWQVDNLAVDMDAAGNVKPTKDKSGDKIDGFSAAVDAMAEVLANMPKDPPPAPPLPRVLARVAPRHDVMTTGF